MHLFHIQYFLGILALSYISGIGFTLLLFNSWYSVLVLSPLFSYSIISLASYNLNYLGLTTNQFSIPLIIAATVISVALTITRYKSITPLDKKHIFLSSISIIFALINGLVILSPALLHNSFNFLNDHATYNIIPNYLLDNNFLQKADVSSNPWTDNVLLYQEKKLRMGSSFYLATITSLFNKDNIILLYPSLTAFSEFLLASSFSIILLSISNSITLHIFGLIIFLFSTELNHHLLFLGFLPQSIGIALTIALTWQLIKTVQKNILTKQAFFLNIIFTASLVSTYQEIVPFHFIISGLIIFGAYILRKISTETLVETLTSYALSLTLSPPAYINAIHGILFQSKGVVGWYQETTFIQYFLEIFGVSPSLTIHPLIAIIIFVSGSVVVYNFAIIKKNPPVVILSVYTFAYLFIITCFRFATIDPFRNTLGHTWNIFKTIQWSYWLVLLLVIVSLNSIYMRSTLGKLFTVILLSLLTINFQKNFKWLRYNFSTRTVIDSIGSSDTPLREYSKIETTQYRPANIFFTDQHPNIAQMPLSILKDTSVGMFIPPDNNQSYSRDKNFSKPNPSHYNWVYIHNPQVSSSEPLSHIVGYNVYQANSRLMYFNNRFIQNGNQIIMTNDPQEGIIRIYNPNASDIHVTSKITINCPTTIIQDNKIKFTDKTGGLSAIYEWGSFSQGVHQILLHTEFSSNCKVDRKTIEFSEFSFVSKTPQKLLKNMK